MSARFVDPRDVINAGPMSGFQWGIVAVMVGLNALDGFDVLAISFASPGIAAAWGVDRAALGIVLSMELVGMAAGSLALGGLADRIGRRATILGCLAVMSVGMIGAATAGGIGTLCVWRVITGLGIGGMLAATNAAVAEAADDRRRALCVVLMASGYPLGSVLGGSVSTVLLAHYDWRAVFILGAACTLAFIPLVLWRAPESIAFLMHRRPRRALARINATLALMGHSPVESLCPPEPPKQGAAVLALFTPALKRLTVCLTLAYFAHIMTFYFILKWIPKIVVDMNFPAPMAAGVLVWASLGGATGSLLLGLLTARLRVAPLTIAAMLFSTGLVILFGRHWNDLTTLSLVAGAAGFCTNAGVVGLYALIARSFPTGVRATATGFVIGVGRGGSALAPALAGLLFAAGYSLPTVAFMMASGSVVAVLAILVCYRKLVA